MDYMEQLKACGVPHDDAWFIVDDFLSDGDKDGLMEYIRDLERHRYCTKDVIEEVLSHIGLETIQPKSC